MLAEEPLVHETSQKNNLVKQFSISGSLNLLSKDKIDLTVDIRLDTGHEEGTIYIGNSTSSIFSPSDWNIAEKEINSEQNVIIWRYEIPLTEVNLVWGVKLVVNENKDNEETQIQRIYFSKSQVYSPQFNTPLFPEKELPQYKDRLETGVCFSGGGTRSMLLSMGQMKYLQEKGYWKKAGYYTSVSGGSWASTIYSYAPEKDATTLLGEIVPPSKYVDQINDKSVPNLGIGAKPKVFGGLLLINLLRAAYPFISNLDEIKAELEKYKFIEEIDKLLSPISSIPADRIWIDTVGMSFFHPNGLYKLLSRRKEVYTLNQEEVDNILNSGGSITKLLGRDGANIKTVALRDDAETYPPYYIANGLMLRPTGSYTSNNPSYVGYEFTPLYGAPAFDGNWSQLFSRGPKIGGGNALSYTFGQQMVGLIEDTADQQTLLTMHLDSEYLPSLSVASGISSSAFAGTTSYLSGLLPWKDILQFFLDYFFSAQANSNEPLLDTEHLTDELLEKKEDIDKVLGILGDKKEETSSILKLLLKLIVEGVGELIDGMTPKSNYFSPVDSSKYPSNTLFNFGDGGLSDNFGLISLLRRGVKQVVVFVNTSDPFEVTTDENGKETISIDATIPAFFGIINERPNPIGGQHWTDMQVFNTNEYEDQLLKQFKSAHQSNGVILAETELQVLPNKAWDLEGGYTVNVLWYYNSLPAEFTNQAGEEVMRNLIPNKADEGKADSFPFYNTFKSTLLGLKPFEINMMGNIGYWNLKNTDTELQKIFDS